MHDKEEVDTAGGQKVHILWMDTYSFTFSLGESHTWINLYEV